MEFFVSGKEILPPGMQIGKVVANYDSDQRGKIRVAYYSHSEQNNVTNWVRVISPMAGEGRGLYLLPEVGDEVLVGFINNDPASPCVIGSLWNGTDSLPEGAATEKNIVKTLVTRSGIKITLSDEDKKEKIAVKTPAGMEIAASDEGSSIIMKDGGDSVVIEMDGKNGDIVISANRKITIKSKEIELSADKGIALEAGEVTAKANGRLSLQGTQAEINAKGSAKLGASGVTEIKGSMVKING